MEPHHILLVDDEINVHGSLKRLLTDEPYELHLAANGAKGLELLQKQKCQVIVSDYRMPEMDGITFLHCVSQNLPDTIRIIMTGYADFNVACEAIDKGKIYKFITKPWDGTELKLVLRQALQLYDLQQHRKDMEEQLRKKNFELETINEHLEEIVHERTASLQSSLEEKARLLQELHNRVKELEGRDRLLQYLLEVHPIDETLDLAVQVIRSICNASTISIYLKDCTGNIFILRVHWESSDHAIVSKKNMLKKLSYLPYEITSVTDFISAEQSKSRQRLLVPIQKGPDMLGSVIVEPEQEKVFDESIYANLAGIAGLLAVAIADVQLNENFAMLNKEIETILRTQQ